MNEVHYRDYTAYLDIDLSRNCIKITIDLDFPEDSVILYAPDVDQAKNTFYYEIDQYLKKKEEKYLLEAELVKQNKGQYEADLARFCEEWRNVVHSTWVLHSFVGFLVGVRDTRNTIYSGGEELLILEGEEEETKRLLLVIFWNYWTIFNVQYYPSTLVFKASKLLDREDTNLKYDILLEDFTKYENTVEDFLILLNKTKLLLDDIEKAANCGRGS